MSGLGRVLLAECGRTEDLDLFLRGQLDAFAACVHQFLHCLDGALQPLGLVHQQPVLPSQVPEHIRAGVIEQHADLVQRRPDRPVHQHKVQPLDVGVGVAAGARRGTDARHHQTDVVIVVQGAHGETRQSGYRADGVGVHAATVDPDAA